MTKKNGGNIPLPLFVETWNGVFMSKICYTSLRRTMLLILAALMMTAVAGGIFLWMLTIEPDIYDENCEVGVPEALPAEMGYSFYPATDICDVWLCGNPDFDGKNIDFFLTNPKSNEGLSLRLEIYTMKVTYDENGNPSNPTPDELLGKSGFVRPGEYVKTVKLDKTLKAQTPVILKIGTYLEETGKSNGFFYVSTILTPKQ